MSEPRDRQGVQVAEGGVRFGRGHDTRPLEPSQDLTDLGVEEMRRREGLCLAHASAQGGEAGPVNEKIDDRRCVDDDQRRPSLSAWTAEAASTEVGRRIAMPARISSRVGRLAISVSSITRYSERLVPARAARTFSVRCTRSGTLRTWIIFPAMCRA